MKEISWFLSTLNSRDYLPIARQIPGFPQDLRSPGEVKKLVEDALQRGYHKINNSRRRQKVLQMNIRDLYKKLGTEYIRTARHLVSGSVGELVQKLQVEPKIKPHQHIAVLYVLFTDEFDNLLPKLLDEPIDFKNPLGSLTVSEPVIIRLQKLLDNGRITFENLIPEIQDFVQSTKTVACEAEDQLFHELMKVKRDSRLPLLFNFLTSQERYKNSDYHFLCDYALQDFYSQQNNKLNKDKYDYLSLKEKYDFEAITLRNRVIELKHLETELAEKNALLEQYRKHQDEAATTIQEIEDKLRVTKQEGNEALLWKWQLSDLIGETKVRKDNYAIITEDINGIVCSTFGVQRYTKDQVMKWRKQTWNSFHNPLFFVIRNHFNTSDEWNQFTSLLNKHGVDYRELIGYEEIGHIAQIISYMLEDEYVEDQLTN